MQPPEGLTRREIAKELGVTVRTLDRYIQRGHIRLTPTTKSHYLYIDTREEKQEQGQESTPAQQQEAAPTEDKNTESPTNPRAQDNLVTPAEINHDAKITLKLLDADFDYVEGCIRVLAHRVMRLEQEVKQLQETIHYMQPVKQVRIVGQKIKQETAK
jgi:hypothetical protein